MGLGPRGRPCPRTARKILMKSVWSVWPKLHGKIAVSKRVLLILDFDGTLTKIAKSPSAVVFEQRSQDVLRRLSRLPKYRIAIVSGRSLSNLKSYFNLRNVIYAGNHGLELSAPGLLLPPQAEKARKMATLVWLVGENLTEIFSSVPGILIEDKGYTLSLHYRNLSKKHLPFFRRELSNFKKKHAKWPIVWKAGKKVWEVRPAAKWGKGHVASYLSKKFHSSLPVVIGDDVTDEDMFKALRGRGVTIRVGRSKRSLAQYRLGSPRDVVRFLERSSGV